MKKVFTILMALMVLCFTQCKPTPENGEGEKVKITCEIPMNGGGSRSDFSNLLTNGKVNWSGAIQEFVYLAIHGDNPQIVRLESRVQGQGPREYLKFEAEVEKGLISEGTSYDIWYFGSSHRKGGINYQMSGDNTSLSGSIAKQTGRLDDLGDCHIATTSVMPTMTQNGEEIKLSLNGTLQNQIAIVLLNLEKANELYGDAIAGTEYSLKYNGNTDRYELSVEKNDGNSKIAVQSEKGISYVALLPNEVENTEIRYNDGQSVYECIFYGEIEANNFYYRTASDGTTIQALEWFVVSSGDIEHDDHYHHYVDLGLPSGNLWATHNVGADTLYKHGDYFAWGEIKPKTAYTIENCVMWDIAMWNQPVSHDDSIRGISGNANYDAATAIWGDEWRMPTMEDYQELYENCTRQLLDMPTPDGYVKGWMFIGPNNNRIFIPLSGYRDGELYGEVPGDFYAVGEMAHYWHSSVLKYNSGAGILYLELGWNGPYYYNYHVSRYHGCNIRPIYVSSNAEHDHE